MQDRATRRATYGPWLVGLGAALWGTESAWRIPLNALFDASVIVFWEHVLILIMFLPLLMSRLDEIRKIQASTWGYLLFSGFAGSAVGTIFFTLALKYGNPTVVNVILNIQPVISTMAAFLIFGDRLAARFFLYAGIAFLAGFLVSLTHPALICVSFKPARVHVVIVYDDADAGCGMHNRVIFPCEASPAPVDCGHHPDCCRCHGAPRATTDRARQSRAHPAMNSAWECKSFSSSLARSFSVTHIANFLLFSAFNASPGRARAREDRQTVD